MESSLFIRENPNKTFFISTQNFLCGILKKHKFSFSLQKKKKQNNYVIE